MEHPCEAYWTLYLPYHPVRFPYIILAAHGEHSHHPPYPSRAPADILDEVTRLVAKSDHLATLTTSMFLVCPRHMLNLI